MDVTDLIGKTRGDLVVLTIRRAPGVANLIPPVSAVFGGTIGLTVS